MLMTEQKDGGIDWDWVPYQRKYHNYKSGFYKDKIINTYGIVLERIN